VIPCSSTSSSCHLPQVHNRRYISEHASIIAANKSTIDHQSTRRKTTSKQDELLYLTASTEDSRPGRKGHLGALHSLSGSIHAQRSSTQRRPSYLNLKEDNDTIEPEWYMPVIPLCSSTAQKVWHRSASWAPFLRLPLAMTSRHVGGSSVVPTYNPRTLWRTSGGSWPRRNKNQCSPGGASSKTPIKESGRAQVRLDRNRLNSTIARSRSPGTPHPQGRQTYKAELEAMMVRKGDSASRCVAAAFIRRFQRIAVSSSIAGI